MTRQDRNLGFDILKVLSATIIVLHHYDQATGVLSHPVDFFGGKFNFGLVVDLFFVISGFLASKYDDEHVSFSDFIFKRLIRIIPILALSVAIEAVEKIYFTNLSAGEQIGFGLTDIIINSLGLWWGIFPTKLINQPTWYLSVLVLCYIVQYFTLFVSRRLSINRDILTLFTMLLGVAMFMNGWNYPLMNNWIGRGYFSFFAGALIARHIEEISLIVARMMLVLTAIFFGIFFAIPDMIDTPFIYSIFIWIPIVIYFGKVEFRTSNSIIQTIIVAISQASFGVFVWNEPLYGVRDKMIGLMQTKIDSIGIATCFCIINWLVGFASYYLLERTISMWLKRNKSEQSEREKMA